MSERKTYFIVPGEDYAPNDLIQLGQIVSDLKLPHRPLSPALQPLPQVRHAWKTDHVEEQKRTLSGSTGVFSQALLILGGDVSGNFSTATSDRWVFDRLETEYIEPDEAYVNLNAQVPIVKEYLSKNGRLGKSVYMITGVKIARGARAVRKEADEIGGEAKVSLNAALALGAPVEVGPKLGASIRREGARGFGGSSDFVFAYRLRKIFVRFSSRIRSKEMTGGKLEGHDFDVSDSSAEDEEDEEGSYEIESISLDSRDLGSDYLPVGYSGTRVRDEADDVECQAVWLREK